MSTYQGTYVIRILGANLNPTIIQKQIQDPYFVINLGGYMHIGSISQNGGYNPIFQDIITLRVTDEKYMDIEIFDYVDYDSQNFGQSAILFSDLKLLNNSRTRFNLNLQQKSNIVGVVNIEIDYRSQYVTSPLDETNSNSSTISLATTNNSSNTGSTQAVDIARLEEFTQNQIIHQTSAPNIYQNQHNYLQQLQKQYPYKALQEKHLQNPVTISPISPPTNTTNIPGQNSHQTILQNQNVQHHNQYQPNFYKKQNQPELHIQTPNPTNFLNNQSNEYIQKQQQQQLQQQPPQLQRPQTQQPINNNNNNITQNFTNRAPPSNGISIQPNNTSNPSSGFSPSYQINPYAGNNSQPNLQGANIMKNNSFNNTQPPQPPLNYPPKTQVPVNPQGPNPFQQQSPGNNRMVMPNPATNINYNAPPVGNNIIPQQGGRYRPY